MADIVSRILYKTVVNIIVRVITTTVTDRGPSNDFTIVLKTFFIHF
jgi:hypothetical protein